MCPQLRHVRSPEMNWTYNTCSLPCALQNACGRGTCLPAARERIAYTSIIPKNYTMMPCSESRIDLNEKICPPACSVILKSSRLQGMSFGARKRECIHLAVSKLRSSPWMFDSQKSPRQMEAFSSRLLFRTSVPITDVFTGVTLYTLYYIHAVLWS
jgi:hypothetical protein